MEQKTLVVVVILSLAIAVFQSANAQQQVPAVFILGDSTADTGTNNFLPGIKDKANFPPYGIDFPYHTPTGRFSNGLNSADFLAKELGFKRSPLPFYILANNTKLIRRPSFRGANFASAGSGLLNLTGQDPSGTKNVVTFEEQMEQLSLVISEVVSNKGQASAEAFVSKSLFFISVGSNDIFGYQTNSTLPKQEFLGALGMLYEASLRKIYKLGGRKVGIVSVPPIGCCPYERFQNSTGGCIENLNDIARDFHSMMNALLMKLSLDYKDLKYSIGNTVDMTLNVINNPSLAGLREVANPCCGDSKTFCGPNATYCSNRHQYLFWDAFHPTMVASKLAASTLYDGPPQFVAPINFRQLAQAS
ncbi:GDSL esterase/lipase At1g71250-like [Euphorbia lathyris]|uniref:GDSL esterase/lipase At1g71250-like n=1 Tax=Euphorbia lathyris TaxID=212925 RepID=UPI0033137424